MKREIFLTKSLVKFSSLLGHLCSSRGLYSLYSDEKIITLLGKMLRSPLIIKIPLPLHCLFSVLSPTIVHIAHGRSRWFLFLLSGFIYFAIE